MTFITTVPIDVGVCGAGPLRIHHGSAEQRVAGADFIAARGRQDVSQSDSRAVGRWNPITIAWNSRTTQEDKIFTSARMRELEGEIMIRTSHWGTRALFNIAHKMADDRAVGEQWPKGAKSNLSHGGRCQE